MRKRRWREQGDIPAAKESAGSVVELFIIPSPVSATCGPFGERMEERWERVGVTETEMEWDREDQGMGMIPPSCVVQMPDCVQASPVQAFGTVPAWWCLPTAQGEQLCTGPQLCRSQLRCGTNRYRSLFSHGLYVCVVLVYLLSVYVLFFWWSPMTSIVPHGHHFLKFLHLAADGPPEVLWVHATMSIFKRLSHFRPLSEQECTWCLGL